MNNSLRVIYNISFQVDDDINLLRESRYNDSDSQEGGGSDSSSNSSTDGNTPSTAQHSNNNSDSDKPMYKSHPSTSTVWVQNSPRDQTLTSRRLSKDESTSSSNSESPQSGDEYHVYFYNSKDVSLISNSAQTSVSPKIDDTEDKTTVFSSLRKCDDPWDVLFARAEGLHAHGHSREACILGVKLAEELLMNPPDLMIEIPPIPKKKGI